MGFNIFPICYPKMFTESDTLTGCLVSVGANCDVVLLVALLGSRYLLQLSDFRHAKLRVEVEERATLLDCQVVLGPIPQLAEVLVVECVKGVATNGGTQR